MLWRWHRRGGLLAALFVLFMAATGVVLNHGAELELDRHFIQWGWLRAFYGEKPLRESGFAVDGRWLTRSDAGALYIDGRRIAPCAGELVGALAADGMLFAACTEELLLLTPGGELIESLAGASGLPVPVRGIARTDGRVVLLTGAGWQAIDTDAMTFAALGRGAVDVQPVRAAELPAQLRAQPGERSEWLSWERFLLDLHSGRLFGRAGVLVVDIVGVLFSLLALSGVSMWWFHRRRHKGGAAHR